MADLYLKRDEAEQAVECRKRVIALLPTVEPAAHIDLGWALQEDGRHDEALREFHIAQNLKPDLPQVHFSLSGIYEEQGNMAATEASVREAIRLQPRYPAAYARLATLLRRELPDDDLKVVEEMLADSTLGSQSRARLLFAIAHVLDARKEYARAAACLREANALTLRAGAPRGYFTTQATTISSWRN